MERQYNIYTFDEYPPIEIFGEYYYLKAYKAISFQYRDKETDKMLAFVSLGDSRPPIKIPEIEGKEKGCEILMADVRRFFSKEKWQTKDYALFNAILDEAELRIEGWCDEKNNNEFEFDYYWLKVTNDTMQEITERIDGVKMVDSIAYKIIERKPLTI